MEVRITEILLYVIFRNYFQHGYTPSLAYKQLLKDLRCECENEDNIVLKRADRSVCPRRGDFNNMYTDYCKTKYGGKDGDAMFENMVGRLKKYVDANTSAEMTYQIYNRDDDVPLIVVIVTPLMARVHSQVATICFTIHTLHYSTQNKPQLCTVEYLPKASTGGDYLVP